MVRISEDQLRLLSKDELIVLIMKLFDELDLLKNKTTLDLTVGVLSFIQILIGFALNLFCPGSQYIFQSFVN